VDLISDLHPDIGNLFLIRIVEPLRVWRLGRSIHSYCTLYLVCQVLLVKVHISCFKHLVPNCLISEWLLQAWSLIVGFVKNSQLCFGISGTCCLWPNFHKLNGQMFSLSEAFDHVCSLFILIFAETRSRRIFNLLIWSGNNIGSFPLKVQCWLSAEDMWIVKWTDPNQPQTGTGQFHFSKSIQMGQVIIVIYRGWKNAWERCVEE
jgi:hypothetical protein